MAGSHPYPASAGPGGNGIRQVATVSSSVECLATHSDSGQAGARYEHCLRGGQEGRKMAPGYSQPVKYILFTMLSCFLTHQTASCPTTLQVVVRRGASCASCVPHRVSFICAAKGVGRMLYNPPTQPE
ncbi:unnamed protein product [Protopolystoma xenopodis]|uniref:Uncharacterized protein n=1 Tax=Protopolystoma xenopodis TaxID=117903 RepID=A0A3S5A726_9PLAT|nr:unnamed protein product [Protopolystoma xenopodis]